jgi:hypothetical protein
MEVIMLNVGDTLSLPIEKPEGVQVYTLVVDRVEPAGNGQLYCFRDANGPVICLREARLAKLLQRFQGLELRQATIRQPSAPPAR